MQLLWAIACGLIAKAKLAAVVLHSMWNAKAKSVVFGRSSSAGIASQLRSQKLRTFGTEYY